MSPSDGIAMENGSTTHELDRSLRDATSEDGWMSQPGTFPREGRHVVNPHNDESVEEEIANVTSVRHYCGNDIKRAITEWAQYNGESKRERLALDVTSRMVDEYGPVSEVFYLDSLRYVAVRFRDLPKVGLYLEVGQISATSPVHPEFTTVPDDNGYVHLRFTTRSAVGSVTGSSSIPKSMCCGVLQPSTQLGCDYCGEPLSTSS